MTRGIVDMAVDIAAVYCVLREDGVDVEMLRKVAGSIDVLQWLAFGRGLFSEFVIYALAEADRLRQEDPERFKKFAADCLQELRFGSFWQEVADER